MDSSKAVGVLANFQSNGGIPAELKSAHSEEDVYVFMDMMRCEWDAFLTA